jgi:hypothetical protein
MFSLAMPQSFHLALPPAFFLFQDPNFWEHRKLTDPPIALMSVN